MSTEKFDFTPGTREYGFAAPRGLTEDQARWWLKGNYAAFKFADINLPPACFRKALEGYAWYAVSDQKPENPL